MVDNDDVLGVYRQLLREFPSKVFGILDRLGFQFHFRLSSGFGSGLGILLGLSS